MAAARHSVISLFSGAMGLDLGLEAAGFEVRVAVECNGAATETIRANRPDLPLLDARIEDVSTAAILRAAGLKRGEATVVTGGPSCQPFSTAGRRGSVEDPRGKLFHEFCRVVREARPRFFVMENVPGMLSAAVTHRPLKERGVGYPPLEHDEQLGSALLAVLRELRGLGYHVVFDVLNAADFGTPQTRERVLFIGSRDNEPFTMPKPTHAAESFDGRQPWRTLREALAGLAVAGAAGKGLSKANRRRMALVPEGGNWRDLPLAMQREALGAAYDSWGGRVGFCRRLAFDRPAPSLTTVPDGRATMLCHPTELRPLSIPEYARIQEFPDTWVFKGSIAQRYKQIGNAFPIGLGRAIGAAIRATMRRRTRIVGRGVIACASAELLERLASGYKTRSNPPRMRKVKDSKAHRAWTGLSVGKKRREITDLVITLDEIRTVARTGANRRPNRPAERSSDRAKSAAVRQWKTAVQRRAAASEHRAANGRRGSTATTGRGTAAVRRAKASPRGARRSTHSGRAAGRTASRVKGRR